MFGKIVGIALWILVVAAVVVTNTPEQPPLRPHVEYCSARPIPPDPAPRVVQNFHLDELEFCYERIAALEQEKAVAEQKVAELSSRLEANQRAAAPRPQVVYRQPVYYYQPPAQQGGGRFLGRIFGR